MSYLIHLLIYIDVYVIVALSLNLVVGYCGMLTLAHASYFALGAYTWALLTMVAGFGFLPALAGSILVAMIASLAVSLPSWRLKGDFFVLASLAVQALLFGAMHNWFNAKVPMGTWLNLTNGPFGIANIPRPVLFGFHFTEPLHFLLLASCVMLCCAWVCWRLGTSPWARVLIAMRENELAARSLGKNTRLLKVQAIAISSGMVAIAGAMYAGYVSYLDPSSASLDENILMLSMVLIGGAGNFRGPITGAILLVALPEVLRFLNLPDAIAPNVRLAIYGLLLLAFMHMRPQGMSGKYRLS